MGGKEGGLQDQRPLKEAQGTGARIAANLSYDATPLELPTKQIEPARYEHLDAARGYAALAVAFCHAVSSFSGVPERDLIGGLAGRSPVLFFFILSGFVLGKSFQREKHFGGEACLAFYIRRFFRLYPPYLAALILAVIVQKILLVSPDTFQGPLNDWARTTRLGMLFITSPLDYLKEIFLYTVYLDGVAWALRVEFVCSFFLPMLHLFMQRRKKWWPAMLLCLILLRLSLSSALFSGSAAVHYLFIFYMGYLISLMDLSWVKALGFRTLKYALILGLAALALVMRHDNFNDVVGSFLLCGLFVLLVPNIIPGVREVLQAPFSRMLGHCSYSLYLVFTPVFTAVMYGSGIAFPQQPLLCGLLAFALSLSIALPLAILLERIIEIPFNRLGHRISNWMHRR